MDAVIGNTGFVGGQLVRQHEFPALYNSRNIDEACGRSFDTVVCAAAPGSMLRANRYPENDKDRIDELIAHLDRIDATRFVLISSIAVLADWAGQDDERTGDFQTELPYGRHRRTLETFCAGRYERCLIVRLSALFGRNLKKNFIFDLINPVPGMLTATRYETIVTSLPAALAVIMRDVYRWNDDIQMHELQRDRLASRDRVPFLEAALTEAELDAVQFTHPDTTFQYYNVEFLWADIKRALEHELEVLHLAPEPLSAARIHEALKGTRMRPNSARIHHEDMRTCHAAIWGREGPYRNDNVAVLNQLRAFYQNETRHR